MISNKAIRPLNVKEWTHEEQDKDRQFKNKDKDKDLVLEDKDKNKDLT